MTAFRKLWLFALIPWAVPGVAHAQAVDSARIRDAVTRGYAAIQAAQRVSLKSQACTTTCHLQVYGAFSYRAIREHGITVDEATAKADLTRGLRSKAVSLTDAVQGNALGEVAMNAAFFMVASHAAGLRPSVVTAAVSRSVALQQKPEGDWPALYTRPPSNSSGFTFTALGLRTLQLYGHPSRKADVAQRIQRAAAWLQSHPPRDTEDRTYQLLGLWWAGTDRARLAELARSLAATQRTDGGWNSIEGGATNAYATGEALVALHDAGGMPTSDPAWRRGLEFLVRTQASDGTWHVETRLPPFISPPYFESGYPYGRDQFISVAGANWAVMALARALGDPVEPRDLALSDVTPAEVEPWVETAMFGTPAELTRLLDGGLSPDAMTKDGQLSLLMLVAPDPGKVKLLLDRGAAVNRLSTWKYSALHIAAQFQGATDAMRLLLDRGAQVRVPAPGSGPTANAFPLFFAARVGNTTALPLLRKAGDTLDDSTFLFGTEPFTPLIAAATFGHLETVRALLDLDADIERSAGPKTPLNLAVANHHLEIVRLLIERGADVNRADPAGRTPLHYAAAVDFGDTAIVELLLKAGARPDTPDKSGVTPRQMAQKSNVRILPLFASLSTGPN